MTFYITHSYYGGYTYLIEQAAKDCNAELIAIKGYALADYPGDREFVEGSGEYLFRLERNSIREAATVVIYGIRERVRQLFFAQEVNEGR